VQGDGKVRTMLTPNRDRNTVHAMVKDNVEPDSYLSTDDCQGYWGLYKNYIHQIVDHAETYVGGRFTQTAWRITGAA
jgi:ISXO2-like transposase domain